MATSRPLLNDDGGRSGYRWGQEEEDAEVYYSFLGTGRLTASRSRSYSADSAGAMLDAAYGEEEERRIFYTNGYGDDGHADVEDGRTRYASVSSDTRNAGDLVQREPSPPPVSVWPPEADIGPIKRQLTAEQLVDVHPVFKTRLRLLANRIIFAKWFAVIYLLMLGLTTFLVVWGFTKRHLFQHVQDDPTQQTDNWYIWLDAFCTVILALEVGLRLVAQQRTFWSSWLNILDFTVVFVCIMCTVAVYTVTARSAELKLFVLLGRYVGQFVRVVLIIKHNQERRLMINVTARTRVDFDSLTDDSNYKVSYGAVVDDNNDGNNQSK
eukprot:TRINITY_DN66613_c5_g7_i1.p1 TRINITY_DN66613_c5_g7~~TRINITY_DN66613_c5_g7_i1.p1  ORF type:complete len:335 (-),score=126.30 TRINITY_DN66613_c5_g7_i1:338-1309(-)